MCWRLKRAAVALVLPFVCMGGSASATEERLTLRAVILKALESNNDIQIEELGRLIEEEKIKVASQPLDPRFEASYNYESIRTPQNAQNFVATGGGTGVGGAPLLTQPNVFMQRNHIGKMTLVDKTASGTTFELGTTMRVLSNSLNRRLPPSIWSPEYETFTGLTVTQPLMRGYGKDANLAEIRIAKANAKIADYEWQARTSAVVAEVMKRYYDVIFTRENILVQREGIALAEKLLEDTRKRSREGVAANNDVVVAEAGVYQRKEEVLAAEMQYIERQNALQLLFKRSDDVYMQGTRIVPVDKLTETMPAADRNALMGVALRNRYEVKQAEQFINARDAQSQLAHSQSRPRLDLVASGGLHGLQGNLAESYSRAFQAQGPEWTAGFQYSLPLNRDHMKATERLANHQQEQAVVQAEKTRLRVLLEVDTVLNRVRIDQQRLAATRKSREAARQSADAELKRLQQGVSTSFQVLQLQRDYSQARSRELATLADFNKSLADLDLTTATVLEKQKISLMSAPPREPAPAVMVREKPAVAEVESSRMVTPPVKQTLGSRIGKWFRRSDKVSP
ncbi:TolC family protein [Prosthecobacter sp.]|uniref:TolC family protein n=1 Tax=Prosthecobacter sp. TaxID=1965333 RepID=UPI001DB265AB|nr:TolC family protein [Prosthecobacter sp.]MCB1279172.1 TolC family protein [Prosthecobacter sp.]